MAAYSLVAVLRKVFPLEQSGYRHGCSRRPEARKLLLAQSCRRITGEGKTDAVVDGISSYLVDFDLASAARRVRSGSDRLGLPKRRQHSMVFSTCCAKRDLETGFVASIRGRIGLVTMTMPRQKLPANFLAFVVKAFAGLGNRNIFWCRIVGLRTQMVELQAYRRKSGSNSCGRTGNRRCPIL